MIRSQRLTFLLAMMAILVVGHPAFGQQQPATAPATTPPPATKTPDKAAAYYHYSMAHIYEELVTAYGDTKAAGKAIDEYRLALENDPGSEYLNTGLAELYARTGRIRDAVLEAQDMIKRDPNNLEAHKLLGRIYLRSLGDLQSGSGSSDVLKSAIDQYEQIVKLEPNGIDGHLLLGRLYRLNNDLQKAEGEFRTSVKLQPDSEEAATMLAYLYNEEGDSKRAVETLTAVPDDARSAKLYAALAYTYEQEKQYKEAINAYKKAVELDHDNLDAIRGLAQNLLNDGQLDASLDQYKIIADANPEDPQTYLRMAEIYRRTGKFEQSLDALKKAEALVPDSLEVPYSVATVYQAQGKDAEAVLELQKLLLKTEKTDSSYTAGEANNRAVFLERLGSIQRDMSKTDAALETFRKMLSLGDENAVRGYQQIIDTYREAKDWPKATATAREAVQKMPNDRGLKMVLASQLADSGEPDKAIAEVRSLLKGDADDRDVYIALAQMLSRLRRGPEAEEAAAKALSLSVKPEEKIYVNFISGSIFEHEKKYDQAEEAFKKILAAEPQNSNTLNYLGYMLADRGVRLEEALAYIKKAVDLEPANGAYLDSLGWAYFKLGKYDAAEQNLLRASQRQDSDPTINEHLADLYQKTGRLKLAASHWERALAEWNKTVEAEVDPADVARIQKKLDAARVKLAKETPEHR
jgi:tetratricopeptide (TPR) repeat protein